MYVPLTEKVRGHNTKEMIKKKSVFKNYYFEMFSVYVPNEGCASKPELRYSTCMKLSIV